MQRWYDAVVYDTVKRWFKPPHMPPHPSPSGKRPHRRLYRWLSLSRLLILLMVCLTAGLMQHAGATPTPTPASGMWADQPFTNAATHCWLPYGFLASSKQRRATAYAVHAYSEGTALSSATAKALAGIDGYDVFSCGISRGLAR
jgi:hypothetical protein